MHKLLIVGAAALVSVSAYAQRQAVGPEPVTFTIKGTWSGVSAAPTDRLYDATADRDSDGDGTMDNGLLTVSCPVNGPVTASFIIKGRNLESHLPSTRRQYQPLIIRRSENGAALAPPVLRGTWDLATAKGARSSVSSPAGARAVSIEGGSSACRLASN